MASAAAQMQDMPWNFNSTPGICSALHHSFNTSWLIPSLDRRLQPSIEVQRSCQSAGEGRARESGLSYRQPCDQNDEALAHSKRLPNQLVFSEQLVCARFWAGDASVTYPHSDTIMIFSKGGMMNRADKEGSQS